MALITTAQRDQLTALFIAMFKAAPGADNLSSMVAAVEGGQTIYQVATTLAGKTEFGSVYPGFLTGSEFADRLITNLLPASTPAAAKTWSKDWILGKLNAGESRASIIATAVIALTEGPGLTNTNYADANAQIKNQIEVSNYYSITKELSDPDLVDLQSIISGVTATASTVTTAKTKVDSIANSVISGTTYTLSTGADNIAGTGGDDIINGVSDTDANSGQTFTAADTIKGGAGTDTLNILFDTAAAVSFPAATISEVEIFNVRNISGQALTFSANLFSGETEVWSDRSTSNVTVTNMATGVVAGLRGDGASELGNFTFGYTTASSAVTLAVDGGTRTSSSAINSVTISSAPTEVTVKSTGAANTIGNLALGGAATSLTIDAATNFSLAVGGAVSGFSGSAATLTVKGAATSVSLNTINTAVSTIDASGMTAGGISVVLGDVATQTVKGGQGNDTIRTGGVLTTGTVDAGAGSGDRLSVAATAHVNTKALADKYINFESIEARNGVDVDVSLFSGITSVRIADGAGNTSLTNLTAAQAGALTISSSNALGNTGITIGVKDASLGGQIDTVTASVTTSTATGGKQYANLQGITLTGVEKVVLNGSGSTAGTSGAINYTAANATSVDSLTLNNKGDGNFLDLGATLASNLNVNASTSGGTTVNLNSYNTTTGATVTTGAGNDIIVGSAKADTISAGDGNDHIYADGATTGTVEVQTITIAGGAAAAASTITVGGVSVSIAAGRTAIQAAGDVLAQAQSILSANPTLGNIVDNGNGTLTLTYKGFTGNVANLSVSHSDGTQTIAIAETTAGVDAATIVANAAADVLTGGAGNDTFYFCPGADNTLANMDTIKDLNFGGDNAGTVDKIVFDGTAGAATIVKLSAAQQDTVTAAATLAAAVDAVLNIAATGNNVAQFTYGGESYLVINGATANATYTATEDLVLKITGVTGTLDASDISII